ncbi:MAG: hypothetical protein RIF41_41075 [Polyangiaceae bacterium]
MSSNDDESDLKIDGPTIRRMLMAAEAEDRQRLAASRRRLVAYTRAMGPEMVEVLRRLSVEAERPADRERARRAYEHWRPIVEGNRGETEP